MPKKLFRDRRGIPVTFKYWLYEWLEVLGYVGAYVCPRFTCDVITVLEWLQSKRIKK